MSAEPLRIGTRGSALALAQATLVAEALAAAGTPHRLVVIQTDGDRRAPDTAWGEGAFVAAIEQALLDGDVDVAVHSAKDVPTDEDARLVIAAYLPRADPHDALVVPAGSPASGLTALPAGTRLGTDSPRRAGFLRAHRPDLEIRPLHGNVDTRLRRLDSGEVDALVLAVAGLTRLGRDDRITERLDAALVPPAPGQGAIAIQVRAGDQATLEAATALDDGPTRRSVEAERSFLRAAGGGCRAPIGALAVERNGRMTLLGGFAGEGGETAFRTIEGRVDDFPALSGELAAQLARQVAAPNGVRPRVLVTRPHGQAGKLVGRLAAHGLEPVVVPAIEVVPVDAGGPLDEAMRDATGFRWVVVTSANGARSALAAADRTGVAPGTIAWAAVGAATASVLHAAGAADVWTPRRPFADAIGQKLPIEAGDRVLLVRGALADGSLAASLGARGASVTDVVAYRTIEGPATSEPLLRAALADGNPSAAVFASGSAARGLLALARDGLRERLLAIPAIAIGPSTAEEVRGAGFELLGTSEAPSPERVATLTARLVHAATTDRGDPA